MSEEVTRDMNGNRSFEERVFARFDALDFRFNAVDARFSAIDSTLQDLDGHLQKLEARAFDTKPIWEQALKEIMETRRELSKRLDRIESITLDNRAGLHDAEDRLDKLELKSK